MSGYIICVDLKSLGVGMAVRSQVGRCETCGSDRIGKVRVIHTKFRLPAVKKPSAMGRDSLTNRMLMKRQPVPNGRILHNKFDIREGTADWRWKELRVGIEWEREKACHEESEVTESSVEVVLRETSKHIRTIEPGWAGSRRVRLTTRGATGEWVSPLWTRVPFAAPVSRFLRHAGGDSGANLEPVAAGWQFMEVWPTMMMEGVRGKMLRTTLVHISMVVDYLYSQLVAAMAGDFQCCRCGWWCIDECRVVW